MAEYKEVFRTKEGTYRILVEQVINGKPVDWFLIRRDEIGRLPEGIDRPEEEITDGIVAHTEAAKRFTGMAMNWTGVATDYGYEFVVAK